MVQYLEITKQFKKGKTIKKYNDLYFNQDNPEITDLEYDIFKKKLLDEEKYDFLKKLNLLKNIVGSTPNNKFEKIEHLSPMLSLSNSFDINDMQDFLKKIKNFLNSSERYIELFSEPKIDGISATLIYEDGILKKGLSRGDGKIGEDILKNLSTIKSIPQK